MPPTLKPIIPPGIELMIGWFYGFWFCSILALVALFVKARNDE